MDFKTILNQVRSDLEPYKFECYPFKIGWYNSCVDERFKLNLDHDTLAILVINTPSMFENLFLPFLFQNYQHNIDTLDYLNDPIDECMRSTFESVKKKLESQFEPISVEAIKDYEMQPGTRRAKIVMQTCSHVSGAAYFYDQKQIDNDLINQDPKHTKKNLFGVCLHPKFGGWFAMRCVFVFKNLIINTNDLIETRAQDMLNGNSDKIADLLKKFNYNWRDGTYREVFRVAERYSRIQQEYFNTEPQYRKAMLREWLMYPNPKLLCMVYERSSAEEMKLKDYLTKNFYLE